MLLSLIIYLIIAIIIFLTCRKSYYNQLQQSKSTSQTDLYVNTSQYGLLLLCLTFPITILMFIIDTIIIYRGK